MRLALNDAKAVFEDVRIACGFHTGQIPRDLLQQAVDILPVRGEDDMGRMVIEVPEELAELGKAMAEQLAEVQRTMARQGGGKAVAYALVEPARWEAARRTEREAHRAILQSLDIDVPAVVIGKERYTRVGRCADKYHTMAGSVSVER